MFMVWITSCILIAISFTIGYFIGKHNGMTL